MLKDHSTELRDELLSKLQALAERATRAVCDVTVPFGYWTDEDNKALDELRASTGKDWDAINQVWRNWEAE